LRESHERYRLVGDHRPVFLRCGRVVVVERGVLQPLERADEEQLRGHRLPVGAHHVDAGVVVVGPTID
jgi:hypothetical protein